MPHIQHSKGLKIRTIRRPEFRSLKELDHLMCMMCWRIELSSVVSTTTNLCQGSVATVCRWGGKINNCYVAN